MKIRRSAPCMIGRLNVDVLLSVFDDELNANFTELHLNTSRHKMWYQGL